MLLTVPLEVPDTAIRVGHLRAQLEQLPDDYLVVADHHGPEGESRTLVGWPVTAPVRDESGRRVPVVALPEVHPSDTAAMRVSFLRGMLAALPADALLVALWETSDGPRQSTVGWPVETDYVDEESGVSVRAVSLPQVVSGATGYAYDELVYNLGWE
ncbi:hypothetical protein OG196_31965 [Kitasatospora purpeofusca]|uniref:hypothetical protein n=1 Tax=Kitasatospora purpeofusca TaxID=67352 RepID=UPI002E124E71|nr:hypothetical protein OG196_31965 [Kitasatospora purpeofusca]